MVDVEGRDRLAVRARDGDREAFAELVTVLRDEVWRFCRSLARDEEAAADAQQETFLRLVAALPRWQGRSSATTFVLAIAKRAVADQYRRRPELSVERPPDPGVPDASASVTTVALIDGLPERLREAFALTQMVGLSYQEAAEVAGVPVGTIRSRVHRARDRLVAELDAVERGA